MDDRGGSVSYIVFDEVIARFERMNKRLWVAVIILILSLVFSNGFWLWRESQFEDIEITQEADTRGGSIVLNGTADGDINYGESETDN